jgi:hypothetical protein
VDPITLPNSDSPEVMEQAVSVWLTHAIWHHMSRYHTDDIEEAILALYTRVYQNVHKAHVTPS